MSNYKKVKIKRFDTELELPKYHTAGAAGFDLSAREKTTIKPGEVGLIPLNIALEIPKNHFMLLAARSSLRKLGLTLINGIGVIDSDFRGDEDEVRLVVQNYFKKTVIIEKGTRVAQGIFIEYKKARWQEVKKLNNKTRGGFGSTGHK